MTHELAAEVLHRLAERRLTLSTAESLTGGGLGERITAVPGASSVYLGGLVAYSTRTKIDVLGVSAVLIQQEGVVSAACAEAMARAAAAIFGADVGLATTGVAGPDPQDGRPAGLVHIAMADAGGVTSRELHLTGGRSEIRAGTCTEVLRLVAQRG